MIKHTATYSPDDNKLRLYPGYRLSAEEYNRVKVAGFKWAPKQELFVAPMWTPGREDLLIEMCGEIGDEDTSLLDRAEERADRFEDYSDKRQKEAESARARVSSIADNIPLGQPILIGHHSERHARKHAEQIENGMRKAVKAWETSQYWEYRAAGAIAHAKHKERPDVRARRIKTIEAEKRKTERNKAEAEKWLGAWSKDGLTFDEAVNISNYCWLDLPRKEGDRPDFDQEPSANAALTNAYPNLYAPRTVAEVVEVAKRRYPPTVAHCARWIAHYENRLIYERAMLAEQGGTAADKFNLEIGGRVLVRGEWTTIVRINKSGGQISSVTTNARYVSVRGVEEIKDYQAPDATEAAKVKAATKLAPLCNYAGENFPSITQAEWDKIAKDYKGTRNIDASNGIERHRVRITMGLYTSAKTSQDWNKRHSYYPVFISDAKTKTPAKIEGDIAAEVPKIPAPERVTPQTVYKAPEPNEFDALRDQLKQGVQVVIAPQLFPTPPDLAARMVDLAAIQVGQRVLEPSAGTGRLLDALPGVTPFPGPNRQTAVEVVAVERNHSLAERVKASGLAGDVVCADFLECGGELGSFDRVLMNPPFENAADIKHIQHAISMLKPGGILVAICARAPRQERVLKPLAEDSGGIWEELPPDTFKDSGTNVNTVLLTYHA